MDPIMKIAALLQHRKVLDFLAENNLQAPAIPLDANTVWRDLTLADGRHAVVLNQKGFNPTAADDEEECNGLSLYILDEPPTAEGKRELLQWMEDQPSS